MEEGKRTEGKQYLTFRLEEETFALEIGKVREVLDCGTITKVPQVPEFMRGVINLRGSVVPVINMRLKFGMAPARQTVNTCIIITEILVDGETTALGALVDSVKEVFEFEQSQIEPPPNIGARLRSEFIQGMGKHGEQFIILLDIDRVFSASDLERIQITGEVVDVQHAIQ